MGREAYPQAGAVILRVICIFCFVLVLPRIRGVRTHFCPHSFSPLLSFAGETRNT